MLLAEGICLLYQLAGNPRCDRCDRPERANGKAACRCPAPAFRRAKGCWNGRGRFSGYAAMLLLDRLLDAWHRWHPEHCRVSENGERSWHYEPPPVAIADAELVEAPAGAEDEDLGDSVEAGLALLDPWERLGARRAARLLADGAGSDEVAEGLGVSRARVAELRSHLAGAVGQVAGREAAAI